MRGMIWLRVKAPPLICLQAPQWLCVYVSLALDLSHFDEVLMRIVGPSLPKDVLLLMIKVSHEGSDSPCPSRYKDQHVPGPSPS